VVKAKKTTQKSLGFDEIFAMDLPPKIKAKLLSSLSEKSVKEWYSELIK
jgi:16S rRNA (cytidine1402-2'-O)-methyltransferase